MQNRTIKVIRNNVILSAILVVLFIFTGVMPYFLGLASAALTGDTDALISYGFAAPGVLVGFFAGVLGILIGLGVFALIYLGLVPTMIFWPQASLSAIGQEASDEELIASGIRIEQIYDYQDVEFTMRDGTTLAAQYYAGESQ